MSGLSAKPIRDRQSQSLITTSKGCGFLHKPEGATQWSTRTMADEIGISHMTVSRVWRTFGLKPHLSDTFKLSTDPFFVEKVRDIVGLYLNPPENAEDSVSTKKANAKPLNDLNRAFPLVSATLRATPMIISAMER